MADRRSLEVTGSLLIAKQPPASYYLLLFEASVQPSRLTIKG